MLLQTQIDFPNILTEKKKLQKKNKSKQNMTQMFKEDLDLKNQLLLEATNDN